MMIDKKGSRKDRLFLDPFYSLFEYNGYYTLYFHYFDFLNLMMTKNRYDTTFCVSLLLAFEN
ncbi:hypothetical protein GCM10025886_09500 [Tetragenococcus halophilus subsp. flandriensis]|nr:hypothetical protein GCM10025886_09500 [Tetragenococcus halophilus subsp. flandriensis]